MAPISVLVTGGAGFIGSHVCEALLTAGHRVVALDNLSTGYERNFQDFRSHPDFTFVQGDIRDLSALKKVLADHSITHISHQAALGSVPRSIKEPLLSNEVNVTGTLNVFWAAKEAGVKRVALAISSSIYGDTPTLPKKETMPYSPRSPYAVTKVTKDLYAKLFYEAYGLETVGLRYFNVYGPRQDPNGPYAAVIPRFVLAALKNQPLQIFGDGAQTRDFTYVQDAVVANLLALTEKAAPGKSFNVCGGKRISIRKLANQVIRISKSQSQIVHNPPRFGDVKHSLGSLAYAKKYLGFSPSVELEDGLKKTVEWFKFKQNAPLA